MKNINQQVYNIKLHYENNMDENVDYINTAINHIQKKSRVMESGTIIHNGHLWNYKIKWVKPRGKRDWLEVFKSRNKSSSFFPDNSKHTPTDPDGKCDLCNAPIYEQSEAEINNYCWNCGVKFV